MKHARWLGLGLLIACTNNLPGEPVGTYRVVMKLEQNTCGAQAIYTTDGKTYSVELREDDGRGYWHIADKPPVQGTLDAERNFKFTSSGIVGSEGPDAGPNGCRLIQDEVLSGSLRSPGTDGGMADAGPGTSALVADHVLTISGYAGTDCSRALVANGGFYENLPCTVRYTLSGTEREPF